MVRSGAACRTREFLAHIRGLCGTAVSCEFSVGWANKDEERAAISAIPKAVWADAIERRWWAPRRRRVGGDHWCPARSDAGRLSGRDSGDRPSGTPPGAQLDAFEERDGWRYTAFATDTAFGQLAHLDARHRAHARVEDGIRSAKDTGLDQFPSRSFAINAAWLAVVMLAVDLIAWTQRLLLHGDLARAEPKALRYRMLHVAARPTRGQRLFWLRIQPSWPWVHDLAAAFARLATLPALTG
jgi:hypothetical protein